MSAFFTAIFLAIYSRFNGNVKVLLSGAVVALAIGVYQHQWSSVHIYEGPSIWQSAVTY